MRPGLAEYDLASLLFDPYVSFTRAEREERWRIMSRSAPLPAIRSRPIHARFSGSAASNG